jgi:DNA-binding PadR family transcriptional regulator
MPLPQLSRLETLILSVLAEKELFGLQVLEAVHKSTGDPRSLRIGSLYTTLGRMEEKGLVASRWGDATGPRRHMRRKYFSPSPLGLKALDLTQSTLHSLWGPSGAARGRRAPGSRAVGANSATSVSESSTSVDELHALALAIGSKLDSLSEEFDGLLARMQTPEAKAGMKAAFDASPKRLGKAAVAAARKRE